MVKLAKPKVTQLLESLRTDLVTLDTTRTAGDNDKKPPHEQIVAAVTREVTTRLRKLNLPPGRLEEVATEEVARWNHYLTFAFDRKESTYEFYKAHETEIKAVIDCCQKGTLKGQLDRQLVSRWRHTPKEIRVGERTIANPLAAAYQDMAIAHNAALIMGTIGKVLSSPSVTTDLDAADFAADAIVTVKKKMETYDETRAALSTYITRPIAWGVMRMLSGNAQDRFDRSHRRGLGPTGDDNSEITTGIEAVVPRDRDGTDGLAFVDDDTRQTLFRRLRAAGEKLDGESPRKIFAYKLDHPVSTLEETGNACGCTKENVRQVLKEIGRQMVRLDPELAGYIRALINKDEDELDVGRLSREYDSSPMQKRAIAVVAAVEKEVAAMELIVGTDNISQRNGTLRISREATRGNKRLKAAAEEMTATYDVLQIVKQIAESPFVDAGFDVLSLRDIKKLAFYPGGSQELEAFIENNIEAMAEAGRKIMRAEMAKKPSKQTESRILVDRFYESKANDLPKFKKHDINALFFAPESSEGEIPDASDLLIVRKMGVASVRQEALQIKF